jgi:gliding motility-associated-like protein
MEKDKKDIDNLLKESFDNYEPDVKPKVWNNVKSVLKWGSAGLLVKFVVNKLGTNTIVAFVSSAVTVIGTLLIMNKPQSSEKTQPESNKTEITSTTSTTEKTITTLTSNNSKNKFETETNAAQKNEIVEMNSQKEQEKSFKNTSIVEVSTIDAKKIKSIIKDLSEKSVAKIAANPISGAPPLVVNLSNMGTGSENTWTFSDGQSPSKLSNPPCVFIEPGVHTVVLQSKSTDGKIAMDSIQITVTGNSSEPHASANTVSPDGDGVADVFTIQGGKNINEMETQIFDKKGTLVYKWVGVEGQWDGTTLKGEKVAAGIYYYIVNAEGIDGKRYEQKGKIKLIR